MATKIADARFAKNMRRAVNKVFISALTANLDQKKDQIEAVAEAAANKEIGYFFQFVAVQAIGRKASPQLEFFTYWPELNQRYIRKKGNDLFFVRDMELQKEIQGLADEDQTLEILGPVRVQIRRDNQHTQWMLENTPHIIPKNFEAFELRLVPFTKIAQDIRTVNGADVGTNENLAHYMDQYLTHGFAKLMNTSPKGHIREDAFRPVLLPSVLYFARYRITAAIAKALDDAGLKVTIR